MASKVTVPFKPHPFQVEILKSLKRFNVFVCHRRFGKTVLTVNLLVKWAVQNKRHAWRAAYIAPLYRQAEEIAWDYLRFYTSVIPNIKYDKSRLRCDIPNGSRISLLGADNPDSLRGPYWDAVVFDEYAQIRPKVWPEIIRPTLVDRKGWAIFIGTPMGHNHFYDLWMDASLGFENKTIGLREKNSDWAALMYRASQTNILDPDELLQARREMTPEQYEQEFECSFEAALIGAYYGALMQDALVEGRITQVPFDPVLLVHTAWDIGVDDATCIWFFQVTPGGAIKLIDYHEDNNLGLDAYIRILKEKKYVYGQHLFPHDISAREPTTAKPRKEFVENLGIKVERVKRVGDKADGIQAVRSILPRCWFDEIKCDRGIQTLKSYRKEYSSRLSTYRDSPLHDWASHGADSFQTLALGLEAVTSKIPILKIRMPSMREHPQHGWMGA